MAWFSKKRAADQGTATRSVAGAAPEEPPDDGLVADDHLGRPVTRVLNDDEQARIAVALERLASQGVDVDDLAAIGAGFDTAFAAWRDDPGSTDSGEIVDTYAVAIGEHLARHSARDWSVVTDVFGTDLGLVAARAETVIVPHNLVGVRWLGRETGWIPGVVSHLVSLRPSPGASVEPRRPGPTSF